MELQEIIKEQSKQLAQLTDIFGQFLVAQAPSKMVYLPHQDNEGGGLNTGKIGSQFSISNNLKGELEMPKKEKEKIDIPNVRIRKDGRLEWQKMVFGVRYTAIARTEKALKPMIKEKKEEMKLIMLANTNKLKKRERRELHAEQLVALLTEERIPIATKQEQPPAPTLYQLCHEYCHRYKTDLVSFEGYESILRKWLIQLNKPITDYTKDMIYDWLHKDCGSKRLCFQVLKSVFADAAEKGIIPRNIIATLKRPDAEKIEGRWFTIAEQKLILDNIEQSGMENEIMFYLMTGCRLSEAWNAKPDFDKNSVYVTRTKKDGTSGWVNISLEYSKKLKEIWPQMFKRSTPENYSRWFSAFLTKLGIKYPDTSLHSLRHTFCTNLYYLGVPNKTRQYLMGHKTSAMTNDLYTTYDPNVTKQDIIDLYTFKAYKNNFLYPNFENINLMLKAS